MLGIAETLLQENRIENRPLLLWMSEAGSFYFQVERFLGLVSQIVSVSPGNTQNPMIANNPCILRCPGYLMVLVAGVSYGDKEIYSTLSVLSPDCTAKNAITDDVSKSYKCRL
jgi:hypothetical protein